MNKIIRLEDKKDSLINYIKSLLEMAEKGEIDNVMVSAFAAKKQKNDKVAEVLTGYYNLGHLERQYLIASLQTDLAFSSVKANIDELIEIINE